MPLPMRLELGTPTLVHTQYQGVNYTLHVAVHVFEIAATGRTGVNGLPEFSVTAAPVMQVKKSEGP